MSKLFFFASGGSHATRDLRWYAVQGLSHSFVAPFEGLTMWGARVERRGRARLWAVPDTPRSHATWTRIEAGDVGLGYSDGAFRVAAPVVGQLRSRELAVQLFGERLAGLDGVRGFFVDFAEHFEALHVDCPDIRDLGDRVLGLGTTRAT